MNRHAPVPTIEQQRKLRDLLAQDRAVRAASRMHRVVAPAAFPKMQPDEPTQQEPCNFCARDDAPLPSLWDLIKLAWIDSAWRDLCWFLAFLALSAVGFYLLTDNGHALLLSIWGVS